MSEPVIQREEVLAVAATLAEIHADVAKIQALLAKKRQRTAEQIEAEREFRRRSDENLRRLRELVDRGWAELEERRRREQAEKA